MIGSISGNEAGRATGPATEEGRIDESLDSEIVDPA